MRPFSTSTTGTPKAAAAAATESPPDPAPITQMSGVRTSTTKAPVAVSGEPGRMRRRAGAPSFHYDRDERDGAERHGGANQLRRNDHAEAEVELAIGGTRGKTFPIDLARRGEHTVEPRPQERKCEGRRHDADCRSGDKCRRLYPAERGRKIDQEEWKCRHEPQEQEIVESIGAKPACNLVRQRPGTPGQGFAARAPRDHEHQRRARGGADDARASTDHD